jgi:energy-coupling factor transport system permease protein
VTHRRRASALHAARAGAGAAFCAALAACALAFEHPLLLAAVAVAALGAARAAGVGREVARTARFTIPLAVLVAVVNPFVVRDGLTVFARLGSVPVVGQLDLTVEALVYGLVLGARVVVVVLCCGLFSAAIDPDAVLRLFRRVSFRSALTAALATRLVPVLAHDARRMADAQATRARGPAGRIAVLRAVTTGALDRALDVAATLEVRGYAGRPPTRGRREPVGRHDVAFGTAAVALVALLVVALATGAADFAAYPRLQLSLGPAPLGLAVALVAVALAPFLDRRGIER